LTYFFKYIFVEARRKGTDRKKEFKTWTQVVNYGCWLENSQIIIIDHFHQMLKREIFQMNFHQLLDIWFVSVSFLSIILHWQNQNLKFLRYQEFHFFQ
jgi:hypothetical protein